MAGLSEMTPNEVQEYRQHLKVVTDMNDSLTRLLENNDFKKVFVDGYQKDEAVRLVHLYGDNSLNANKDRDHLRSDLQERIVSVARFSEYIRFIQWSGNKAKEELEQLSQAELEFYKSQPQG